MRKLQLLFVALAAVIAVAFAWNTADAVAGSAIETPTHLASLGTFTSGFWFDGCFTSGTACDGSTATFSGAMEFTSVASMKLGKIACTWSTPGTGGTTGFQVSVRNVTDSTTLCTCTLGACTGAAGTYVCACDATPTAGKVYNLIPAGDCTGNPGPVLCNTEVTQ